MSEGSERLEQQEQESDVARDPFSAHEVLHVASIMSDFFDRHLGSHRFVEAHPALRAEAERISEALGDFYQLCGNVVYDATSAEPDGDRA